MITKRNNLFETNSSTMHSLTIAFGSEKEDLKKIMGSDTLRFGTRNPEEIDKANEKTKKNWAIDIDKTYSWQDRADLLFWKLITTIDQTTQFLIVQDKIRKIFEKRGIKVEFLIEPNIDYISKECYPEDDRIYDKLFDWTDPDFELQVINFIFSPYIVEYSYEDNYYSYREIEKLEKEFGELFDEFPENAVGFRETDR
jgi:hypothetical protein